MVDPVAGRKKERSSRSSDPLTLLAGIATLLVAVYVLSDGSVIPAGTDPRWLLAGGAAAVGLVLLFASLRRER